MTQPHARLPALSQQEVLRFWSRVDKTPGFGPHGDCWIWTAGRFKKGYGAFTLRNRPFHANRLAYFLEHGSDPGDSIVCHTCDNPPCCNPAHLYAGTYLDNMRDRSARGRAPKGDNHPARRRPDRLSRGDDHYARTHPEKLAHGDRHWTRKYPEGVRRGEAVAQAKLTAEIVRQIRAMYAEGKANQYELADKFGIHQATIYRILHRKTWKHVE